MLRVGCDIGGTFTDFVILDEASGEIFVEKSLTTPADPSIGLLDGLTVLGRVAPGYAARTRRFAHATTLIANAVIERKGARTALLTTRGFRDVLELRRHVRVTTYELWVDPPAPLVERSHQGVERAEPRDRAIASRRLFHPFNLFTESRSDCARCTMG